MFCDLGQYLYQGKEKDKCKDCHYTCMTCKGASSLQCEDCDKDKFRKY